MAPRLDKSKWLPRTQAKAVYLLTDRELDALEHEERPNPRARKGPCMRLYQKEHLERASLARWGNLSALEAERERRREKREQRAITAYFQQAAEPQATAACTSDEEAHIAAQQQQQPLAAGSCGDSPLQSVGPAQRHDVAVAAAGAALQGRSAGVTLFAPATAASDTGLPSWVHTLPPLIAERVCCVPREEPLSAGCQQQPQPQQHPQQQQQQSLQQNLPISFVLYWMKTAIRSHENPALDAAAAAARHTGLPLLVASFLLDSHPHASLRSAVFALQGLRNVQAELRQQGVELLVYVEGHSEGQHAQQAQQEAQQEAQQQQAQQRDPYSPDFSFEPQVGFQHTPGWKALVRLASHAAVVVAEDFPVPPESVWLQQLAQQLPLTVQLVAVDTACVLPMRLVPKCHEKAYSFRSATDVPRKQRISRTYSLAVPPPPNPPEAALQLGAAAPAAAALLGPRAVVPASLAGLPQLPPHLLTQQWLGWQPLELAGIPQLQLQQRLVSLLRGCPGFDRSVPAASHISGGSAAGYARWERFRRQGLPLYAARRNDAMKRDGVSRLSAFHHWGMVSPFKIAREAALDRSAGAAKFVDEFLVWREIGFNLCLHRHQLLHSLAVLPRWAQNTLRDHEADPRQVLQYHQLDSGTTGDAFWDAAQRQLAKTGELHNNVRMTWGKAFLAWAPSPQAALQAALHCNHKWALDGGDPASYAGVLWCFGMYDGPKAAATTPVSGSLARRSTAAHARRLPPVAYAQLQP